jgi:L-ascorbate metabolism protein UlaG (beta-lactamase superfamily)
MDIFWYGHACCRLVDDTTTIITDPYSENLGLTLPPLHANIVTVSHDNPHHSALRAVSGPFRVIDRPGEYEIGGVFITGSAFYPPEAGRDKQARRNVVFVYEMNGVTVCHLGDIAQVPIQSQVEALGNVDVLLIPVGGGQSLNAAQASELISIIEPSIVIPIHYALPGLKISLDPLDRFLKEMGHIQREAETKLSVRKGSLPLETQVIVLKPAINEGITS